MGTRTRPNTLTPNRLTRSVPRWGDDGHALVLGDPEPRPGHREASRHVAELRIGDAAEATARRVGLVDHGSRWPYTNSARSRKSPSEGTISLFSFE